MRIMPKLVEYSKMKSIPVSIQDLYRFKGLSGDLDQRLRNAQFLHHEIPVRLAQRCVELHTLPYGLPENNNIKNVIQTYTHIFEQILNSKAPTTENEDEHFTNVLERALLQGSTVIMDMAKGVVETRHNSVVDPCSGIVLASSPEAVATIDTYLNRFFMARIGVRFLMEQHIHSKSTSESDGFFGIIQTECNPKEVSVRAAEEATALCERQYGTAPKVIFSTPNPNLTFTYIPGHLHYVMNELLKNSLKATCEFHANSEGDLPPVEVVICRGQHDISIKISDRGGGIPFEKLGKIWNYCSSSSSPANSAKFKSTPLDVIEGQRTALSGYGCGLPLSRLYAQYFGGGLDIESMEGYGTDAFLHLRRVGQFKEALPQGPLTGPVDEGDLDDAAYSSALRAAFVDNSTKL